MLVLGRIKYISLLPPVVRGWRLPNLGASSAKPTSAMLAPNPSGTVGRSSRRPTIARGCTASSKALSSRACPRTSLALLILLDGAVAMREPLPVSTWYALEQREWRIASPKHANSYLFRVDRGEAGGPGICTPATVGACCGGSGRSGRWGRGYGLPPRLGRSLRRRNGASGPCRSSTPCVRQRAPPPPLSGAGSCRRRHLWARRHLPARQPLRQTPGASNIPRPPR